MHPEQRYPDPRSSAIGAGIARMVAYLVTSYGKHAWICRMETHD